MNLIMKYFEYKSGLFSTLLSVLRSNDAVSAALDGCGLTHCGNRHGILKIARELPRNLLPVPDNGAWDGQQIMTSGF